jgi:DNA-binding phage protein
MSDATTDIRPQDMQERPTMRLLDRNDVIRLLRTEVMRAGNQSTWAKAAGVNRSTVNKVLQGWTAPTAHIIRALNLRKVVAFRKTLEE